jgi:hypothetical protein
MIRVASASVLVHMASRNSTDCRSLHIAPADPTFESLLVSPLDKWHSSLKAPQGAEG